MSSLSVIQIHTARTTIQLYCRTTLLSSYSPACHTARLVHALSRLQSTSIEFHIQLYLALQNHNLLFIHNINIMKNFGVFNLDRNKNHAPKKNSRAIKRTTCKISRELINKNIPLECCIDVIRNKLPSPPTVP